MREPSNLLTRSVLDDSVVEYSEGHLRVWWGDFPIGGKVQTKGSWCHRWSHDWFIDEYPGMARTYRDKVCKRCQRRKPLN